MGIISEYDNGNDWVEINKKISSTYKDRDTSLKYSIKKRLIEDSGLTQNSKALILAFLVVIKVYFRVSNLMCTEKQEPCIYLQ